MRHLWVSETLIRLIQWKLIFFRQFSPAVVISACLAFLLASFRTRSALQIEILALSVIQISAGLTITRSDSRRYCAGDDLPRTEKVGGR